MSSSTSRIEKLNELKKQRLNAVKDNVKLVSSAGGGGGRAEKASSKSTLATTIALERKSKKLEDIKKKLEEQDMDQTVVKRKADLVYSINDVERWKVIQDEKAEKMDTGFSDFSQKAAKKYKKTIGEFTPNLTEYNKQKESTSHEDFYRDANSMAFVTAGSTTSQRGIDRLAQEVQSQAKKAKEFSRRRAHDEEADVTFINERNMRFNKKISRAFDSYTKDIKDSFERGTAL